MTSKVTNPHAMKALVKARTKLLLNQFFFGRLATYLQLTEALEIPTLAVDGKRMFYNPNFVLTLDEDCLRTVVAHEVMHCALGHIHRRRWREPGRWNHATDYAVNLILEEAKFKPVKNWLLNKAYAGMPAEEIYNLLPPGTGDGDVGGEGGAMCDVRQAKSDEKTSADQQAREWEAAVVQAATEAKRMGTNAGKLPGQLERLVDELTHPVVPWRDILSRFLTNQARDDFSWRRANRRYIPQGLYMPSLYSEEMGRVAVIVDTSGSISGPILNAFAAEIRSIAASVRPEKVTVIYADAEVNHVDEFGRGEEIVIKPHGGGGTDFRPAVDLLNQDPPMAAVYLTDLCGPTGDEPDFPMLWCCTTDLIGPWGETVKLNLDA